MRNPVKRLKLYEKMKADIASGIYSPGMFLPNEFELAEKYGYARGTVRSTLAILENDKLIELLKGKGRRICQNEANSKVPLTFLLPCPGFASLASSDIAVQISSQLLEGVARIAFERDYKVETVPVSPTNDTHDIDWRKLDFVNANSMLVVNSPWFRDLFPLLLERRCRTVFIYSHIVKRKDDEDFMRRSFCILINNWGAIESAVEYLFKQKCRRIALFHRYISKPEHPVMGGYLSGIKKCGLKFAAWHELSPERMQLENIRKELSGFYKKSGGFDSLIITPDIVFELSLHNLYQELGLPEHVKIIVSADIRDNQRCIPSLTSVAFPYEKIGRIAAQYLLSRDALPGKQLINASIIERESTSAGIRNK